MKILFVYKYLTPGGVETVLKARIEMLLEMGVNAYAWFLGDHGGREIFKGLEERILIGPEAMLRLDLSGFDLVSSIDTEEIIPQLGELPSSTRVVFEAHTPYLENLEYLRSKVFHSLNVSKILVPSNYQKEVVTRFGIPEKMIRVVPNLLGKAFFSPAKELPQTEKPIMLWVGRLDHLKNWKGFLDIVAAAKKRSMTFQAMMVGSINLQHQSPQDIYIEIKKRSISDVLIWYETLPYQQMPRLYDLVQVSGGGVISTSRNESFGLTVAEAMARGCVVLAPDEGPFPEFLETGSNGFLYDRNKLKKTVSLIQSVLGNHELRDKTGTMARADMARLFHPDAAGQKFYSELQDIY